LQTAATTTTSTVARCAREASNPRSGELHLAFMLLGCAVVCQRMLRDG
jgi:hypothetical protein